MVLGFGFSSSARLKIRRRARVFALYLFASIFGVASAESPQDCAANLPVQCLQSLGAGTKPATGMDESICENALSLYRDCLSNYAAGQNQSTGGFTLKCGFEQFTFADSGEVYYFNDKQQGTFKAVEKFYALEFDNKNQGKSYRVMDRDTGRQYSFSRIESQNAMSHFAEEAFSELSIREIEEMADSELSSCRVAEFKPFNRLGL